jgi:hypothetical protein
MCLCVSRKPQSHKVHKGYVSYVSMCFKKPQSHKVHKVYVSYVPMCFKKTTKSQSA